MYFQEMLFDLKDAYWTLFEETNVQICPQALHDLIQTWNRENIDVGCVNEQNHKDIWRFLGKKVRLGLLGKTSRFWILFIYDFKLVFMLIFAAKTNNKKLFHKCSREVANFFLHIMVRNSPGECFDCQIFDMNDLNSEKL